MEKIEGLLRFQDPTGKLPNTYDLINKMDYLAVSHGIGLERASFVGNDPVNDNMYLEFVIRLPKDGSDISPQIAE